MSSNAERFGLIVRARREQLDLIQTEVTAAGGPSNTKMTEIEQGRLMDLSPLIAKKLDKGLRWESGSARRTWLGGTPNALESVYAPSLEAAIAEVEASGISESTKRYVIAGLLAQRDKPQAAEAGETA